MTFISVGYNMTRSIGPALSRAILAFLGSLAAFGFAAVTILAPHGSVLGGDQWRDPVRARRRFDPRNSTACCPRSPGWCPILYGILFAGFGLGACIAGLSKPGCEEGGPAGVG
ncbi:MFS transporter [Rhizobium laguerreae]|uniref:MFS transporter n=1 Tax=Rhizobium laguerreae TaxID=1076926 RepID=UPI0028AEDF90|nr:MFS transporter [Rhizobium laguerreae]